MEEINKKISIVCSATPVNNNIVSWGLSKVNLRLFKAINNYISFIATSTQNGFYSYDDIDDSLKPKCIILPNFIFRNWRIMKLLKILNFDSFIFDFQAKRFAKKIAKDGSSWIFAPIGVDVEEIRKAVFISKTSNIPLCVYLVDDFVAAAELKEDEKLKISSKQNINEWMQHISKIFVISEGLQNRIKYLYNKKSEILNLPYDRFDENINIDEEEVVENQIVFVGNISHFYIDGIKDLVEVINLLRLEKNINIKIRFTLPDKLNIISILGDYDFIEAKSCKSDAELQELIRSSLICFAPYSFKIKYKTMVETSFPSKILDYMAMGRYILVYGPDYSTAVKYFKKFNLQTIIDVRDKNKLADIILLQIKNRIDLIKKYRSILNANHSINKIGEQITNSLFNHIVDNKEGDIKNV